PLPLCVRRDTPKALRGGGATTPVRQPGSVAARARCRGRLDPGAGRRIAVWVASCLAALSERSLRALVLGGGGGVLRRSAAQVRPGGMGDGEQIVGVPLHRPRLHPGPDRTGPICSTPRPPAWRRCVP